MEENKQKNSRRRLNSLILLVAFTAIMLIVSTYAWFSTQRNVKISNLVGTVKVAEGLEISLDADKWSQEVDFSQYSDQTTLKKLYGSAEHNIIPTELLPVSSNGTEGISKAEIPFYRGVNENTKELNSIVAVDGLNSSATATDAKYPGYYAIDLFLRNSSRIDTEKKEEQGKAKETLQLSSGSTVALKTGGSDTTGLQNTPRVAFAVFKDTAAVDALQDATLEATTGEGKTIEDVAIWEPNSNAHVPYIVTNYNDITWKDSDATGYLAATALEGKAKYTATEKIPTYALTADSVTAASFTDLYNWDGTTNASLKKQISLQTDTGATAAVKNLISVSSPETAIYTKSPTEDAKPFQIKKNTIVRLRMYVWLEGQDPDCVNYASHGGGIEVDVGLCKGEEVG